MLSSFLFATAFSGQSYLLQSQTGACSGDFRLLPNVTTVQVGKQYGIGVTTAFPVYQAIDHNGDVIGPAADIAGNSSPNPSFIVLPVSGVRCLGSNPHLGCSCDFTQVMGSNKWLAGTHVSCSFMTHGTQYSCNAYYQCTGYCGKPPQ